MGVGLGAAAAIGVGAGIATVAGSARGVDDLSSESPEYIKMYSTLRDAGVEHKWADIVARGQDGARKRGWTGS